MNPRKQELQSPVGSEEQLRLFVDGIKDYAMFMLDPEGRILTWNQGAERIKGYKLEEIRGRHFSIFYSPEDIERQEPQRELKIAALEGRFEADGWRLRKDGSRFWANVVLTALRDPSGQLRGFGKVTRDLTERKWAADATFEKLFRASPHPTSIATFQDGRFVEVNEAFCRLTGYSAQELIGRTSIEMQLWTRPQERIRLVSTLKSGKPMVAEEGGMRTKSGAERTVLLSASGIEIGGESCIFATFQDITESRRLEAAVRELSTPVLQAQDRLLIVPLIGPVDAARASQLRDQLLDAIRRRRAKAVVIDLTGVPKVDARIADGLLRTVEAARLLGASVILAGISHGMAQALIDISVGFGTITTTVDLQSGIEAANRLFGQEPTRGLLQRHSGPAHVRQH
jgi:PAS domain S-box-containing protein